MHGYGGHCDERFANYLGDKLGVYSICIEPCDFPDVGDYSMSKSLIEQGAAVCKKLLADPNFDKEFDLIGFSQGTLVARYILQHCPIKGKIRNFVSFGGPLNGQSYRNGCSPDNFICVLQNWFINDVVYLPYSQQNWSVAGYWKNKNNMKAYCDHSVFLAEINNECKFNQAMKDKFVNLNKAMFIKWRDDGMIRPVESSWWGEYDR